MAGNGIQQGTLAAANHAANAKQFALKDLCSKKASVIKSKITFSMSKFRFCRLNSSLFPVPLPLPFSIVSSSSALSLNDSLSSVFVQLSAVFSSVLDISLLAEANVPFAKRVGNWNDGMDWKIFKNLIKTFQLLSACFLLNFPLPCLCIPSETTIAHFNG
jgi:hypothetical protein